MNNWIIFLLMIVYLYLSNYLFTKFILSRYKPDNQNTQKILELKKIPIKSIEQQLEYVKLLKTKEDQFGGYPEKILFIMLFVVILGFLNNYGFIICILLPILYILWIQKSKDIFLTAFNYLTMFNILIFILIMFSIGPLMIGDFKVNYFFMILLFLGISVFQEKIYKFIIGGIKYGKGTKK